MELTASKSFCSRLQDVLGPFRWLLFGSLLFRTKQANFSENELCFSQQRLYKLIVCSIITSLCSLSISCINFIVFLPGMQFDTIKLVCVSTSSSSMISSTLLSVRNSWMNPWQIAGANYNLTSGEGQGVAGWAIDAHARSIRSTSHGSMHWGLSTIVFII